MCISYVCRLLMRLLMRLPRVALPPPQVPGSYGFIAQCNEGRLSKKRPTEFRIDQARLERGEGGTGGTGSRMRKDGLVGVFTGCSARASGVRHPEIPAPRCSSAG